MLYTTYYPLPTNAWYNQYVAPFQSQISSQLQSCASPGLYYEVQTGGDISAALNSLFQEAVATIHLSRNRNTSHVGGRNIFKSIAGGFAKAETGATAVEFALIAPAFFALLFAILETSLIFFAQQALQTATTQASRLVMTGQAQSQNMTATQFKTAVCTAATSLFNCSNIYINMQTFSSFSSVTMLNPVTNGTFSGGGMSYTPGNPGDVVVVQVFYPVAGLAWSAGLQHGQYGWQHARARSGPRRSAMNREAHP